MKRQHAISLKISAVLVLTAFGFGQVGFCATTGQIRPMNQTALTSPAQTPQQSTAANNRVNITTEYEFFQWSTDEYQTV